jgi:hypothetical protein
LETSLESLVGRFLSTFGVTVPIGYHTLDVLLNKEVQDYFGGRDQVRLAFSPDALHEHPEAELVTFGSPFWDTLSEIANNTGQTGHHYLNSIQPTRGRTLEKVTGQLKIPGHLAATGTEQTYYFHHALFGFKVTLTGEDRIEFFSSLLVDLHTGWMNSNIDISSFSALISGTKAVAPELALRLSLGQAYLAVKQSLTEQLAPLIQTSESNLKSALQSEQKQISEHYQKLIDKMELDKTRRGIEPASLEAKKKATRTDLELRLEDLTKRYRLNSEIQLNQMALVSYAKSVVPLRLQHGQDYQSAIAVWDSLTRLGYVHEFHR